MRSLRYLRSSTARLHTELEELVGLKRDLSATSEYVALLQRFARVHMPLEAPLTTASRRFAPELRITPRVELLERDLRLLGSAGGPVVSRAPLPLLDGEPQVAGVAYVIEGSLFGAARLAAAVAEQLGLTARSGAAFFSAIPDHGHWTRTARIIDDIAERHGLEVIASSASDAYRWAHAQFRGVAD